MKPSGWSRRRWLASLGAAGAGLAAGRRAAAQEGAPSPSPSPSPSPAPPLALKDYQPKSMLHVAETKVPRSRYPAIDMHTHLSWTKTSSGGVSRGEEMNFLAKPEELIAVMDRKNVRMMVNLTGGTGQGLVS